jgi:putative ABC transport system permease protein
MMVDSVPYARKSLLGGGLKLVIGVAGVAASLVLILLILGFRTGIYASITAYADNSGADLFVGQEGATGVVASSSSVSADLRERIQSASGATSLAAVTLADVIFEHGERKTPVLLVGYEPGNRLGGPWRIGEGTEPADDSSEILFDRWLALENQIKVGDTVEILGEDMEVVGAPSFFSPPQRWMRSWLLLTT